MSEKKTSHKMMTRKSDVIDVDDLSAHSYCSTASIGGIHNEQAPLENCMAPPPNPHSGLIASQHFLLDSCAGALGVSLVQPPPEKVVCHPTNKFCPTIVPDC